MGRCGGCRAQTQRFCFVHQEFVCDACLVNDESKIHGRCVVNTYRKWVQNSAYDWPPTCSACSVELDADGDHVRRTCLHLEHASCLENSEPPSHSCGACQMPLEKSLDSSEIGKAIQKRIMKMPALGTLVPDKQFDEPEAQYSLPTSHPTQFEAEPVTDNMERQPLPYLETPRTKFRRQNAALQIIETDVAQNVSQVSPEPAPEAAPDLRQMPSVASSNVLKPITETRLNMEMPRVSQVEQGHRPNLSSLKRDKGAARNVSSTSMRKALKAGNRRWNDLRKTLFAHQKQVAIVFLFVLCISLVAYLMSGDDSDLAMATKPIVEEISLPYVRVNPSLVSAKSGPQRALQDAPQPHANDIDESRVVD